MKKARPTVSTAKVSGEAERLVELELFLGLGPEDAVLILDPNARCLDVQPWFLDCVAVKISCLGHQDEIPRPWDWENVLTLLKPGEELLYVLDHVRADGTQTGRPFTLWLALRFPRMVELSASELDRRRKRAQMVVSQFQRQAFPGSELGWVDPAELQKLLGFTTGSQPRCVCVSGLPSPRELEDGKRDVERRSLPRNYQSLNDVAESLIDLTCDYRIAFVMGRVDNHALNIQLAQATTLRDFIHPLVRVTRQEGGSDGFSRSRQSSRARSKNTSKQTTKTVGGNKTDQSADGWAKSVWEGLNNAFHPLQRHTVGARS
ncbi:MAG: hypothetical protein ACYCOU_19395, partial [Sulfobacillus sp.]